MTSLVGIVYSIGANVEPSNVSENNVNLSDRSGLGERF